MGKGARLKREKQRKALTERFGDVEVITPVDESKVRYGQSYWVTGYYWKHDMVLVEPFCANYTSAGWEVTNLEKTDLSYYEAKLLMTGEGTRLLFEDRVMALRACEAIEGQNTLLESFATYMSAEELSEYLNTKGEVQC